MFCPIRGIPILGVLVEGPIAGAHEPFHTGSTQPVFPPTNPALMLADCEAPGPTSSVRGYQAHPDDRLALGPKVRLQDCCQQVLPGGSAFWAGRGLASGV